MNEKNKELKALIALIGLSVLDSVKAFSDGVQLSDALVFANLEPRIMPAIQGLPMDVAEVKALWEGKDPEALADLLSFTVAQFSISDAFAGKVVTASLGIAVAGMHLLQVLMHKDEAPAAVESAPA